MKPKSLHLVSTAILSAIMLAGCVNCEFGCHCAPKVWEEADKELALSKEGISCIDVATHNGQDVFNGSQEGEAITVSVAIKAGGSDEADAKRCLEAIELVTRKEGDTRIVTWKWKKKRERSWQGIVSFEIALPSALAVVAETHNGDIDLLGMDEAADIETHNGNVKIRDHEGPIEAETHNGDVAVEAVTSVFRLGTHNGNVAVRLSGSATLNGSIQTYNGSVTLGLGDEASARLALSTHNGKIDIRREINDMVAEKRFVRGAIGSGQGKVDVSTHNGSIEVE